MNPEFVRNLWLEATPFRLALIAGVLLLVFAATSLAPGMFSSNGSALGLYFFFVVLWGTRSAALSVVGEIRERTWDGQKLSAIGPIEMVWGKLLGATVHNWFGGLICLPFILMPVARQQGMAASAIYGVILLTLGVFAQSVALLSSLTLIRRQTGNWRLDTFLCQVGGILAAFAYYALWSSAAAFVRSNGGTVSWWGHDFNLSSFHLTSLLLFCGWALVGCWRAMRAELRFANGPFVWLAYLLYTAIYEAGFGSWIAGQGQVRDLGGTSPAQHAATLSVALAASGLLVTTYGMAFLEPKDPVRLRWLGEQLRAKRFAKAFMALDAWMLSLGATLSVGLGLALLLLADGAVIKDVPVRALALPELAVLGFLVRDVAMFVLMRRLAGGKGDFAAVAVLGVLYCLLPVILHGSGLGGLEFLFLPSVKDTLGLGVVASWAQGLVAALLARRSVAAKLNAT
jgi:hypothetical protein